jgi:hypothetical protein
VDVRKERRRNVQIAWSREVVDARRDHRDSTHAWETE